jgi:hypothetical protein
MEAITMRYQIIDTQTKQVIGTYSSRVRASRKADRMDLAYGAIRYMVKPEDVCISHFSTIPCAICSLEQE